MVALSQRRPLAAQPPQGHFSEIAASLGHLGSLGGHLMGASSSAAAAAAAPNKNALGHWAAPVGYSLRSGTPAAARQGRTHELALRAPPDIRAVVMQAFEEQPMVPLGLGLMVVGTIASALGMLCLKRAHGPAFAHVPWYRNSWFWLGVLLFVVTAAGLDVVVFAIVPLSLIAPFAGLTIVVSFCFATIGCCGVRETPTKTSIVAVAFITAGVTICSVFGPHDNGELDPADLCQLFDTNPTLFALCISGGFLFFIFSLTTTFYADSVRATLHSWSGALLLALLAALFAGLTQLQFKALSSALLEGIQVLFDPTHIPHQMYTNTGQFVLQILTVLSSAIAQIGFLNYAISAAPVAYSVPAYQAGLLIATLVLSGWVLGEYDSLSFFNNMMFWLGSSVVASGMLLNAWGLVRAASLSKSAEGEALTTAADGSVGGTHYADEPPAKAFGAAAVGAGDEEAASAARKAASAKFG